jgi:glyoxylase-like metal-dependent hydrolase (beta-lactamase superfamily II)
MPQKSYQFKLGNFQCTSILDTVDPLDYEFIFPEVPAPDISSLVAKLNLPVATKFEITSLLIKTAKHNVLVDTGIGTGIMPKNGELINNLLEFGVSVGDIDIVILTHGHLDHIGGTVDAELRPSFPRARYFIQKSEWEFWESNPDLSSMSEQMQKEIITVVNRNLFSLRDKISLIDSGTDIVPGIQFLGTPGHTPGHASLLISSGAAQMVYTGDVFHSILQLARPDWHVRFDHFPKIACETRIKFLDRILSTNTKVFACHFPFPSIGNIVKKDGYCLWQPL